MAMRGIRSSEPLWHKALENHLVRMLLGAGAILRIAHRPGHHREMAEQAGQERRRAWQVVHLPGDELRLRLIEMQQVRQAVLLLGAQQAVGLRRVIQLGDDARARYSARASAASTMAGSNDLMTNGP